jgi:hypothetical protein
MIYDYGVKMDLPQAGKSIKTRSLREPVNLEYDALTES